MFILEQKKLFYFKIVFKQAQKTQIFKPEILMDAQHVKRFNLVYN